jgi:hypothetical protein
VDASTNVVFAEIRVMYLLTNFVVCALEGSTMTGERGFQCVPPILEAYMSKPNILLALFAHANPADYSSACRLVEWSLLPVP